MVAARFINSLHGSHKNCNDIFPCRHYYYLYLYTRKACLVIHRTLYAGNSFLVKLKTIYCVDLFQASWFSLKLCRYYCRPLCAAYTVLLCSHPDAQKLHKNGSIRSGVLFIYTHRMYSYTARIERYMYRKVYNFVIFYLRGPKPNFRSRSHNI